MNAMMETHAELDALSETLSSEYMLADIRLSQWSGKFGDHAKAVEIQAKDVRREFFPGKLGEGFRAINKLVNQVRAAHYQLTLPWSVEDGTHGKRMGSRLLANGMLFDHAKVIAEAEKRVPQMLDAIAPHYDAMVNEACANFNEGRFTPESYPSFDEIRQKYAIVRDYSPVPVPQDFSRMNLPGKVAEKMMGRMYSAQREMLTNAVNDLFTRAKDALSKAADRLADDPEEGGVKKRLFDTVLTDVIDARKQMLAFKLDADPTIAAVCDDMATFHDVTMKEIKKDNNVRRRYAKLAAALVTRLGGFGDADAV